MSGARRVGRCCLVVMAACLVVAIAGCTAAAPPPSGVRAPTTTLHELSVDGWARTYRLHVADDDPATTARPLLLVLHGGGGSARQIEAKTGFSRTASSRRLLVAYPDGTGSGAAHTWNAGRCCGYAQGHDVDDVAFLAAVIRQLVGSGLADPDRVFVAGFSNGGMMAYRFACERADLVAGIAVVSGAQNVSTCAPASGVSVLIIHGTADPIVPYGGGPPRRAVPGPLGSWSNASVADAWAFWTDHNSCPPPREGSRGASSATVPRAAVTVAAPCAGGTRMERYTIDGGGHEWPTSGSPHRGGRSTPGSLDATTIVTEFALASV